MSANRYEVTLAEGHVEVSSDVSKWQETLISGEKAIIEAISGNMRVASADTYAETAWKDGKMVFRREKFETITKNFLEKFGSHIQLEDEKLRECTFTATFTTIVEEILYLLTRRLTPTPTPSAIHNSSSSTYTKRTIKIPTK
jgi:ferric-dicitrate binding protein FerR (iron transport regulator)